MKDRSEWFAARRAELEASNKDSIIDFMQWATAAHNTYGAMLDVIEQIAELHHREENRGIRDWCICGTVAVDCEELSILDLFAAITEKAT